MSPAPRRRKFDEREALTVCIDQGAKIPCYRCGEDLFFVPDIEREHVHELGLDGKDTPYNCRYSHKACHALVTNGTKATTAGSSKQRIAKVKRLQREMQGLPKRLRLKRKIASRPFAKAKPRRTIENVEDRT